VSDTFFSEPPHWEWLIIWYFFLGGIAGGSYFLVALLDLWGEPEDRPTVRLGYYVAFVSILLSGLLLTLDLSRPARFWHMLVIPERGRLMFKYWSPMSFGSWIVLGFGGFASLAALVALEEEGRVRWSPLGRLRRGVPGIILTGLGGLSGILVAGYTGVLLSVSNRILWADTDLLGVLFLLSGTSTAAATLILLSCWRGSGAAAVQWLSWLHSRTLVLELLVLAALVVSLGSVARIWLSAWGGLLVTGVVFTGILLPLVLHACPRLFGHLSVVAGAVLVLTGGFLLRVVIVLSAQRI
jgi:formate-dependent nitrite reductase membrane component NrfD